MTQPLPIDVSGLLERFDDPAHDLIRSKFLQALNTVWINHLDLLSKLTAAQGDLTTAQQVIADLQAALADLTERVAALENPTPPPDPTPTTQEARADGRH